VRKRRRVKDPYAIDTDDDDEDLLTALPKSKRPEESLIDFLRNVDPPPQNDPKPILPNGSSQASSSRNGATPAGAPPAMRAAAPVASSNYRSSPGSALSNNGSRMMTGGSGTGSVPRSNQPRLQARVAGARDARAGGRSEVNDLADFLRTSGPPEPVGPPPGAAAAKKEEGRLRGARFWRKKTYAE
jgi:hypothetical protein